MSETVRQDPRLADAQEELAGLKGEIEAFQADTLEPLKDDVLETFAGIGAVISREIGEAAKTGRLAVKDMVADIISEFAKLGAERLVRGPLEEALTGIAGQVFGGARAGGGPVTPGASYLVGERGPEIFTPRTAGHVGNGAPSVTVNLSMPPSAMTPPGFERSQAQLAGLLARAVGKAVRNG